MALIPGTNVDGVLIWTRWYTRIGEAKHRCLRIKECLKKMFVMNNTECPTEDKTHFNCLKNVINTIYFIYLLQKEL